MSHPERAELDARIATWMRESDWCDDEERFEELALALFAYQFENCPPYARFCRARDATPAKVRLAGWRDIPRVPTGAFKEMALRCFPEARTVKTFRTSGTSTAKRGELHLDRLDLYEASLLATIRRFLFPDLDQGERMLVRVLAPSPAEAPDSSLSHMFGCTVDQLGAAGSGYDMAAGKLMARGLMERLAEAQRAGRPVALCGTAFAFVHLLESGDARAHACALPAGSRVMETGGFKGRASERTRDELYAAIEEMLGIPPDRIVNQYGMTELGSQFYDSNLQTPDGPRRKLEPPWARVRIIDPESGRDLAPGEIGMIAIHDLANVGSVAAIQTADLGRLCAEGGFEALGREPGAEARGCSVAVDAMLGPAPARGSGPAPARGSGPAPARGSGPAPARGSGSA